MKRSLIPTLIAAALAGAYLWACAIDFNVAVFTFHRHPDFPRSEFLAGKLGVLEPTYARSYLYVAYRYLSGLGFNAAEREQVRSYWDDRLSGGWDNMDIDWEQRWLRARARVSGVKPPQQTSKERYDPDTRSWTLYCADDAFRTAITTMEDRRARFGGASAAFREWVSAQDTVFANCINKDPKIPPPASPGLPALARADRDYQIAAAYLYAGDEPEAERRFRQVAADTASPWHGIAPYLVARSIARFAELPTSLKRAETELRAILSNPGLAPIHGISANLLRRVRQHAEPEVELSALARALMRRHSEDSLRQDLWDYTKLIDNFLDWDSWEDRPGKDAKPVPRREELTDWILAFQGHDAKYSLERWRKSRSLPWLVAALSHMRAGDAAVRELMEPSAAVGEDSPAFLTVAYHRNRLRIDLGEKTQARDEVDAVLSSTSLPRSSRNHFRSLRMLTGGDLADFLHFAQRAPVLVASVIDEGEIGDLWVDEKFHRPSLNLARFDRDSIKVLNERTPLRIWRQAVSTDLLPPHLQEEFVLSGFARAILLADDEAAQELEPSVLRVFAPSKAFLGAWSSDRTNEERRFTGIFALLHMASVKPYLSSGVGWTKPSSHMDSYWNNWWCALGAHFELDWDLGNSQRSDRLHARTDADEAARRASFLKKTDIAEGRREMEWLAATGCASNYLSGQVLAWSKSHPADPRIPESLALAVRTTRYSCKDENTKDFSRDAWIMLHTRYPKSEWARKTPYWFD